MKQKDEKQAKEKKAGAAKEIDRRCFCSSIGNTATGMAAVGGVGVIYKYLSPNVLLEIPPRFKAGRVENIQPGTTVFEPDHSVFIFRERQGYFYALSAICTHLGCTTTWAAEGTPDHKEGVIRCPCHGSVFSKTGEVLVGPAPRHLDRFKMTLVDDQLVVDTEDIVSSVDEMILKV